MSVINRMGGFIGARIIETKNIETFSIKNDLCSIVPKAGKSFIELDVMKNGITPNISAPNEKPGQIWKINILIELKNELGIKVIPFNRFLLILKNPLGEEYVFGSKSFPLSFSMAPILSPTASGKMGELLDFQGKQPFKPYKMAL